MHFPANSSALLLRTLTWTGLTAGSFGIGASLTAWAAPVPSVLGILLLISSLTAIIVVTATAAWQQRTTGKPGKDAAQKSIATHHALTAEILKLTALDRAVLDTAADGILVINTAGTILKANKAAYTMFRAEAGTLVGTNVSRLMPQPHQQNHDGYIRRHLQTGEKRIIGTTRELDAKRLDGEVFPIELSVASTELEDKTYFTGFVRDVSVRKRLESELAQSARLRSVGQLASGIAHEMNTPLQYIRVNTEYLESSMQRVMGLLECLADPATPPPLQELTELKQNVSDSLTENLAGLNHLIGIVAAMKEFAHPGSDQPMEFDLNACVTSAGKVSNNHWRFVADLQFDLDPKLPKCVGSSSEACQAVLNLLINAADAIKDQRGDCPTEKGRIAVRTRHDDDWIYLEVENDGPSILPSVLTRVFDPFFTTKPVGKGTGQGLAITYSLIVDKHQGKLEVENLPDKGCKFTASFPRPTPADGGNNLGLRTAAPGAEDPAMETALQREQALQR